MRYVCATLSQSRSPKPSATRDASGHAGCGVTYSTHTELLTGSTGTSWPPCSQLVLPPVLGGRMARIDLRIDVVFPRLEGTSPPPALCPCCSEVVDRCKS